MKFTAIVAFLIVTGLALAQNNPVNMHILRPKISKERAKQIALHAYPGKVTSDVRFENYKETWQYAVYIQQPRRLLDVIIDPQTGKILLARKAKIVARPWPERG